MTFDQSGGPSRPPYVTREQAEAERKATAARVAAEYQADAERVRTAQESWQAAVDAQPWYKNAWARVTWPSTTPPAAAPAPPGIGPDPATRRERWQQWLRAHPGRRFKADGSEVQSSYDQPDDWFR